MTDTTRRAVLAGAAALGAVAVLAGCGDKTPDGGTKTPDKGDQGDSPGAAGVSAKTSEIPVGGGKVFDTQKVVVTQPTAGQFKAFTAVCTHQGCTVSTVKDGTINCPCHGSKYSIADGSVQGGPAPAPLAAKTVTVNGDEITVA